MTQTELKQQLHILQKDYDKLFRHYKAYKGNDMRDIEDIMDKLDNLSDEINDIKTTLEGKE